MSVRSRSDSITLAPMEQPPVDRAALLAQRRAWTFVFAAFGVWCVLALGVLWSLNQWRKSSHFSPPAQLVARKGIVLYQGPRDALPVSISEATPLEEGGVVEVPTGSEAYLQLGVDGSTVRMRGSSRLRLATMRVGRFNRELTQLQLELLEGAANYHISGELGRQEIEVRTPHTTEPHELIRLPEGDYLVWVQPRATRLTSYAGQASVESGGQKIRLRDNKWAVIGPDRPDGRQPMDLPEHLIKNRDFSRGMGELWSPIDIGERGRPDVGGQRAIVEEQIGDQLARTLRITRDTIKDTHNETGLRQEINRDVSAYRGVTFSGWVKVSRASLDGGGYAGSEYPMMFRINYVAENGGDYTWAHGFYVKNETNRPAELGELIQPNQWYHFSLDMTKLRDRPAHISSVEVLGSGHDFDAQVAGIQLIVE